MKNVHIQYDIPEKYELANGSKNEDTFESVARGDTVKLTGQIKNSNVVNSDSGSGQFPAGPEYGNS